MPVFLPLLDKDISEDLLQVVSRIGPVVVSSSCPPLEVEVDISRYILIDHTASGLDIDTIIAWLDSGVEKVIAPLAWAKELVGIIPAERLIILLDVSNASAVSDSVRNGISGVLVKTPTLDTDLISSFTRFFAGSKIYVLPTGGSTPSQSTIRELRRAGTTLIIPTTSLTLEASSAEAINVGDAFVAPLVSDRPDGLFPTVVTE